MQSEIDDLDNLYFAFDFSILNSASISILDELLLILNVNPEIMLGITSYTDSRGSASYNQILSERRLQSTMDYLFENGIESSRIEGTAYGESKLINECDDNTTCSEAMHKANRRSEIKIVN